MSPGKELLLSSNEAWPIVMWRYVLTINEFLSTSITTNRVYLLSNSSILFIYNGHIPESSVLYLYVAGLNNSHILLVAGARELNSKSSLQLSMANIILSSAYLLPSLV